VAIGEVELVVGDRSLIDLDGALVLLDQELLVGDLLLGDRVLRLQPLIAGEVASRLIEEPGVVGELALGLFERRLVGARVDLGQELTLLHHLAFLEPDAHQLAVDLGHHRHGIEGCHGAERIEDHRHLAAGGGGDADGLGRGGRRSLGRPVAPGMGPEDRAGDQREDEEGGKHAPAAADYGGLGEIAARRRYAVASCRCRIGAFVHRSPRARPYPPARAELSRRRGENKAAIRLPRGRTHARMTKWHSLVAGLCRLSLYGLTGRLRSVQGTTRAIRPPRTRVRHPPRPRDGAGQAGWPR
jgi:hypothetical protein